MPLRLNVMDAINNSICAHLVLAKQPLYLNHIDV